MTDLNATMLERLAEAIQFYEKAQPHLDRAMRIVAEKGVVTDEPVHVLALLCTIAEAQDEARDNTIARAQREEIERLKRERAAALSVQTREGLSASEWLLRTGKAEAERDEAIKTRNEVGELYLQQRERAEKADADIAVLRHELDVLRREMDARLVKEYDRGWNDGHGKGAERYISERDKEREEASALRLTVQAKDVMIDNLQRANKSLSGLIDARTAERDDALKSLAERDETTGYLTVENERLTAENTRLSGLNELRLKKLNSADGKLDITVMGETLVNAAKGLGAAEYCSWSLQRPGTPDAWELIVQRINSKRPAEELGRLCNALAEMIGFPAPPSPDGSANLWSPEARQRLLDVLRGALCSPKNLTRLLSGCYGYLVALPESHRPDAGWLEPVEVALGMRVKP